ncbi:phosphate regulon sensor histidine kinase PhoR [Peristeroidobacter agariperforans]|uniref:phosphate regulon sensor histidine kinase PhoR n=1 Tax=Peristeroidobacter agariperforans TaxID=268404 RepID=UPI00101CDC1A|nr:phosphate regulon sensor histidine kinase PhoR [Peristeroidobacter agariperforans]
MKKILSAFSPSGWRSVSRLGIALAVAFLIGLMFGRVALALAITFGIYSIVQLWNVLRVEYWLRHRRVESPPDISGVWGEVVTIISRIYRRKQFHRARVTGLLREFRRLTSAMPEGAVLLGPDHEILWFNGRAGEWLRLRRKRDVGIRVENLVRHPAFVDYLKTGHPSEGPIVQDLETDRWLAFNIVRTGTAERQLLMVRDVSQEQQLQSMRKDFVANASHELRSPLTVISGYLDALADDEELDPAWNTPVLEMRRQAERMRTIIKDLLELSKLESGEHTQEESAVDMAGMLALLRKEVMALDERPRNVRLQLESDALLKGVESELHSVASNLITNAVKYTPAEGDIELRWWVDDAGAHLSVRDTGVGIAEEHIPRLTERFYRVDPGRARSMGGSGLGLAIVKHALQRHDATLEIKSKEGVGSTFTCHFPRTRVISRSAGVLATA